MARFAADNNRYIMRITGDNDEGKAQLDNFIDPESTYPVIATTSQLMSTGVDAQTCHLIVLDKSIGSMTEFKQSYNKGKPIRIEEFQAERDWWGNESDGFASRVENDQAWRVPIETIKSNGYNLDVKNPHNSDTGPGDVDHLLPEYEKLLAQIAETRGLLKAELQQALTATAGAT